LVPVDSVVVAVAVLRDGRRTGFGPQIHADLSAQALNLFNDIDYGTPVGSVIPTLDTATGLYGPGPQFGKSTSLPTDLLSRVRGAPHFLQRNVRVLMDESSNS